MAPIMAQADLRPDKRQNVFKRKYNSIPIPELSAQCIELQTR